MRIRRLIGDHGLDLLVVAMMVVGVLEAWLVDEVHGSPTGLSLFVLVAGGAVLARHRFPVAGPAAAVLVLGVEAVIWDHAVAYAFSTFMLALIVSALFGLRGPSRAGIGGLVLVALVVALVVWRDPGGDGGDLVFALSLTGFAWLIGFAFHERNRRTAELEERAARLERERETEARAAVAEERARIAREMHDVVAHSLSVMVVQAEAAEAMLESDPERARRPLEAVQETGRSALGELRRMLGVLREMAEEGPALAPQPGLAGLDALVEQVREAGLPVTLRVEGEARALPPGIDLSAYRIVQEGLTNALKHAGPARAEVLISYGDDELALRVSDDGRGHDPASDGAGHGLVGMRERVALYGGTLEAGPLPGGGFALTARLPLEVLAAR
jgi:signal transduction histidine kinase